MMTPDEIADALERIATRYQNIASSFRITGRFNHAATAQARSDAFRDAAQIAREGRDIDWAMFDHRFPPDV
jgi:hypothetical protein